MDAVRVSARSRFFIELIFLRDVLVARLINRHKRRHRVTIGACYETRAFRAFGFNFSKG